MAAAEKEKQVSPRVLYAPDSNPEGRVGATDVCYGDVAATMKEEASAAFKGAAHRSGVDKSVLGSGSPAGATLLALVLRRKRLQQLLLGGRSFMFQLLSCPPCHAGLNFNCTYKAPEARCRGI